MTTEEKMELKEVLDQYDLGELVYYERNTRGYVNTSFAIHTLYKGCQSQYFLRKYKPGISEDEIQFEHSIIERLEEEKTCPVAHLFHTKEGRTYFHRFTGNQNTTGAFYAIFGYLLGEDRFTWVSPYCSDAELSNAAVILAQFHQAMNQFVPCGKRIEPDMMELLPVISEYANARPHYSKHTVFDEYLIETLPQVLESLLQIRMIMKEPQARNLLRLIIHCDFHPGNLKYEGDRVVGLFDFDWSKKDARCFDVGLALWYFCTCWQGGNDGTLRFDQVGTFLRSYQKCLSDQRGLDPLSPVEGKYLPFMIDAGSLYIYYWTILDYYQKDVDPQEYLMYLKHCVNFTRWFEDSENQAELKELVLSLTESGG